MITGAIKNMKYGRLPDFDEHGELVEIPDDAGKPDERNTAFARYMSDAMFLIPTPQVLQKIITGLDDLYEHDIADLDMQGDLYEYMLGKLSTAGRNGQFRTPKHIREMMVELVAPTPDDVEQATGVFREELAILKDLFAGYDLSPFLDPNRDPVERYTLLAKAAEYIFISTQELQTESSSGKGVQQVSFKTYFLKTVKRMRTAYDICQPSGELREEESALAQCFMAIAGFVRKMSGIDAPDADTMNRHVARMVEEALKYNEVESILESGEEEDIFSPEFFEKLSSVKMPASKLELLIKMLRKQIKEYGKTNQMAAKRFQEMLEETIKQYHERRKHLTAEEAGEAQEATSEEIIRNATEQALQILREMNADRESFRKIGLTFEEKAFYDILLALRDQYNFEYGEDKLVSGVPVNEKCKALAKKVKEIIDTKSSFADWLNNQIVRDQLKFEIKVCLVKNGYPPQYSPEVFRKVMEQVENFEENSDYTYNLSDSIAGNALMEKSAMVYDISTSQMDLAAEPIRQYEEKNKP